MHIFSLCLLLLIRCIIAVARCTVHYTSTFSVLRQPEAWSSHIIQSETQAFQP